MRQPVQVDVQVATELADVPAESDIRQWIERVIAQAGIFAARPVEISVRVVDETESRILNKEYRKQDCATNVLSFPLSEESLRDPPAELPLILGDIVICGPVAAREASEQGKTTSAHWAHLLVHGTLHLIGYDHETISDAREMETLEARILALGGIENPYKTRD